MLSLKIYIFSLAAYARQQVKPLFTDEASENLKKFYRELRQQTEDSQYSVSSR